MAIAPAQLRYTEALPAEPTDAGDCGGDYQQGRAWSRRFSAQLPSGLYAVLTLNFYVDELPGHIAQHEGRPERDMMVQHEYVICRAASDPHGTEEWTAERAEPFPWNGELTDEAAYKACAEFDPATLDWNGTMSGAFPCDVRMREHDHRQISLHCITHRSRHANRPTSRDLAQRLFVCDRGQDWVFIVDTGSTAEPQPAMVDLAGLNAALVQAIEHNAYRSHGEPATLRVYRYVGTERMERLTWRQVGPMQRDTAPDRAAETGMCRFVVTGPPDPSDTRDERVYLETTVTVNLDI